MKLLFEAPFNSLSFGQVSYNLFRAFNEIGVDISVLPIGNQIDLSAFEPSPEDQLKLRNSVDSFVKNYHKDATCLKLWHLNGSESNATNKTSLITFYELDQPTDYEVAIANRQQNVIFSSSEASQHFKNRGVSTASHCHIGFDPDLRITRKKDLGAVHWGLVGKFEKRKHTAKIIQVWLHKYGNNPNHRLTCCISNPFMDPNVIKSIVSQLTQNGKYKNIQFLDFIPSNAQMNDFINSLDVDISGLGTEGWALPSFNATALGKWSLVLNASAQKDWANSENAILVNPSGKIECYDGVFFGKGSKINQGNIYDIDAGDIIKGFEQAETKIGIINEEGLKLQEKFSYKKMAENILNTIA